MKWLKQDLDPHRWVTEPFCDTVTNVTAGVTVPLALPDLGELECA